MLIYEYSHAHHILLSLFSPSKANRINSINQMPSNYLQKDVKKRHMCIKTKEFNLNMFHQYAIFQFYQQRTHIMVP